MTVDNYSKFLIESSVGAIGRFMEVESYYTQVSLDENASDEELASRLKRGDDYHKASGAAAEVDAKRIKKENPKGFGKDFNSNDSTFSDPERRQKQIDYNNLRTMRTNRKEDMSNPTPVQQRIKQIKAAQSVREDAADSYYAELIDMLIDEDYIETAEDLVDLYEAAADAMKRYFEMGPGNASKDLPKGAGKNSAFRDLVFGKDAFDKLDKMQRNGLFGAK